MTLVGGCQAWLGNPNMDIRRKTLLWVEFVPQTFHSSPRDAGSRVCMSQGLWRDSGVEESCLSIWETPQGGKRGENRNFLRTAVAGRNTEKLRHKRVDWWDGVGQGN